MSWLYVPRSEKRRAEYNLKRNKAYAKWKTDIEELASGLIANHMENIKAEKGSPAFLHEVQMANYPQFVKDAAMEYMVTLDDESAALVARQLVKKLMNGSSMFKTKIKTENGLTISVSKTDLDRMEEVLKQHGMKVSSINRHYQAGGEDHKIVDTLLALCRIKGWGLTGKYKTLEHIAGIKKGGFLASLFGSGTSGVSVECDEPLNVTMLFDQKTGLPAFKSEDAWRLYDFESSSLRVGRISPNYRVVRDIAPSIRRIALG